MDKYGNEPTIHYLCEGRDIEITLDQDLEHYRRPPQGTSEMEKSAIRGSSDISKGLEVKV
jgi:hypothetical protein